MSTRLRSQRTAALSANRAWTSLHKSSNSRSSSRSSKKSASDASEDNKDNSFTLHHEDRALKTLPFHSSKRMRLSTEAISAEKNFQKLKVHKELNGEFVKLSSGLRTGKREVGNDMDVNTKSTPSSSRDGDYKENITRIDDSQKSDVEDEPTYMQIREQNLKANQEFLARIGIQKAKEDFESSVSKKRTFLPSHRGLKPKRVEQKPLPRRQSLRIRRIDPAGVPLPDPEPVEEEMIIQRLPETMSMEERHYAKIHNHEEDLNLKPFFSTFSSLKCRQNLSPVKSDSAEIREFVANINKLKISEDQVAKVVPGRVYSVTWHPSKSQMIAVAGDKNGYIGCWNVSASDNDCDMVRTFQPHIKPVSHLYIPPNEGHKLYTSSFDSTLRCGDFEKGVFDLIYSVPEENDDLFRNFEFIGNSSSMLVSHFRGLVSLVDSRSPSKSAEQVFKVSNNSVRKVSVHPHSTHYFITAGRDSTVDLWDLRSINPKFPKAIQRIEGHSKSIASAYFSPNSGNQILSCSSDDTIQIYSTTKNQGMNFDLTTKIRHNNHTGRWLTPFQPTWHPTVEGIFISGSMARPRQIEVYESNGNMIATLQGDYLASVCSLNAFHPTIPSAVVGANSSGRLHVFM